MKKLIITNWITLDGFIAGPMGEMDWILGDSRLSNYEIGMIEPPTRCCSARRLPGFRPVLAGGALNPRRWSGEKVYAGHINALHKVVVSRSLQAYYVADLGDLARPRCRKGQ